MTLEQRTVILGTKLHDLHGFRDLIWRDHLTDKTGFDNITSDVIPLPAEHPVKQEALLSHPPGVGLAAHPVSVTEVLARPRPFPLPVWQAGPAPSPQTTMLVGCKNTKADSVKDHGGVVNYQPVRPRVWSSRPSQLANCGSICEGQVCEDWSDTHHGTTPVGAVFNQMHFVCSILVSCS